MVTTKPIFFDGATKININSLPEEAWRIIAGPDVVDSGPVALYKSVPFLYRCVDIRAQAVSRLPRDIMRGGEVVDEMADPAIREIGKLLYQVETAMTLYGYAYLFKLRNRVNSLGLRWLKPTSVNPVFDKEMGLSHFERSIGGEKHRLEVEEVVYFWQPVIDAEVGPGTAPLTSAMFAAGVLDSTTKFSKTFFDRGAIFPMLLTVEGNPVDTEMRKLENWWKKMFKGIKSAWETVALRAAVEPKILSSPIEQMAMPELTAIQRENVATALGVPHSLILSNAANFATSQQDYFNFYDQTIVPEADRIANTLNEQYLMGEGLELKFQPKRLEVMQQANLQNADTVTGLFRDKVITRNEAREIVGYDEIDDSEFESDAPPPVFSPFQPEDEDEDDTEALRATDLAKWERKAVKALKGGKTAAVPFDSDHLNEPMLQAILGLCQSEAEVKAVFADLDHIKQTIGNTSDDVEPERVELENEFSDEIEQFLSEQSGRIADATQRITGPLGNTTGSIEPDQSFWDNETVLLLALLTPFVVEWVEESISSAAVGIGSVGLGVDAGVNARAAEWAGRYAATLARNLNATTRQLARVQIRNWINSDRPFESLVSDLANRIGPRWRAELIAQTEVTRAWSQAAQEVAGEVDAVKGLVWQTAQDERVCPICGPLQGRKQSRSGEFPGGFNGPPAHPRCRCWLSFEV